jgi:hypothetical protein
MKNGTGGSGGFSRDRENSAICAATFQSRKAEDPCEYSGFAKPKERSPKLCNRLRSSNSFVPKIVENATDANGLKERRS